MKNKSYQMILALRLVTLTAVAVAVFGFQFSQAQTPVGDYVSHTVSGNHINFTLYGGAKVRVELCKTDLARIRIIPPGQEFTANEPYIIAKYDWPDVGGSVTDEGTYIKIATGEMVIRAVKSPFKLDFYEEDNASIITTQSGGSRMSWDGSARSVSFDLDASGVEEHFYGCGMQFAYFDLRGQNITNWQVIGRKNNLTGENEIVNPLYWSTAGYGILLHNMYKSFFDFGKASPSMITLDLTEGELDFYFFRGPSIKKMMGSYCELTGIADLPPKKALGMHYRGLGFDTSPNKDTWRFWSAAQYDSIANEFRSRGYACDYMSTEPGWALNRGGLTYDPSRFPDPEGWTSSLVKKGFGINHWMYGSLRDEPLLNLMRPYLNERNLIDFTIPGAVETYFGWLKTNHFDMGVTGFKDDTHATPDASVILKSGASMRQYHNAYNFILYNELYKQYKAAYNKRGFVMWLGNLYTGAHRWPVLHYNDLGLQPNMVANSGWTASHYGPEYSEWHPYPLVLFMNAFATFWTDNEWMGGAVPWAMHSPENYLRYLKLHYQLIPYVYSNLWEQRKTGVGNIRPIALEYQDDPATYSISKAIFYGPNLLVDFGYEYNVNVSAELNKPTYEKNKSVYLPEGKWIYYWNDKVYDGRQTIDLTATPEDDCAVFVRGGAIIPMMPYMNYVGEKPIDPLIIDIYGHGSTEFTLFEDDGESFDYEKGEYCETKYENNGGTEIIINARNCPGSYVPTERSYLFRVHHDGDPGNVFLGSMALEKKSSQAGLDAARSGWYYSGGVIQVKFPDSGERMLLRISQPLP